MEFTSLYRRYRPRCFADMKGQDHVVAALQNAIRQNRVFHAYLLSGPRGTGKTTAARILAKALNCELIQDGEPCCECESCLSIDKGSSFDLHELDAASNNKVDDIRDLLSKVALGTPGRTKVYLLDEVHMLTSGAENALLKTLEEPPDHVIFVMATTEPHKVVETIRSRSQHLELNLLPTEQLRELLEEISKDAGLEVGDEGLNQAIREAKGSARDALSALDKIVAGGSSFLENSVDELLDGIATRDSKKTLKAINAAIATGKEPRLIGENLLSSLREAFLSSMGVPLEGLTEEEKAKTKNFTDQVTPALITRSLEILGLSLIDMRRSPDPRVDLEVALVKIASSQPPSDSSAIDLLESRVALLEETIKDLKLTKSVKDEIQVSSPSVEESSKETSDAKSAQIDTGNKENDKSKSSEDLSKIDSEIKDFPTKEQFLDSWVEELLPKLSKKARARFSAGRPVSVDGNGVMIALPNEPHLRRCSELLGEVEASIKNTFGVAVPVLLSVDGSSSSISPPKPAKPSKPVKNDEDLDLSGLVEADPNSGSAVERLSQAFPGAEIVESE
ncbi:MAG: DNA polymerase III subunit gamma/tau [Acidimicrobiales bacterium]|nr:DNA polymerase III subunit gamma/tau [Acidimicrobiales bacterium]MDP6286183.1 DNA polymerase III subunit gamma/tau [Acidimicrobiales bacterium]HJL91035.1 DNA polymerase III subunit gamma/tau [Acidimicrobiales bacterium]HJO40275.1 DNA polymerase III subunit gamma/tau [Acidimicrobiales bacterium]